MEEHERAEWLKNTMRLMLHTYMMEMAKKYGEEPNVELSLQYEEEVISDFLSWAEQDA